MKNNPASSQKENIGNTITSCRLGGNKSYLLDPEEINKYILSAGSGEKLTILKELFCNTDIMSEDDFGGAEEVLGRWAKEGWKEDMMDQIKPLCKWAAQESVWSPYQTSRKLIKSTREVTKGLSIPNPGHNGQTHPYTTPQKGGTKSTGEIMEIQEKSL